MEKTVDSIVYLVKGLVKSETVATIIAWVTVITVAIVVFSFVLPFIAMIFIPLVLLVAAVSVIVFVLAFIKYVFCRLIRAFR